jgi:nitrite reductase/ring-hydroxylating ferredoxin subunit
MFDNAFETADQSETLFRAVYSDSESEVAVAVALVEGLAYAFQDTCTHQSCSLSEGFLDEYAVICPCHQSVFDVRDGQVLMGPATLALQTFDCSMDGASVRVGAPRPASSNHSS